LEKVTENVAMNVPRGERIAPVDGLRALAVMGVIWMHVWMLCDTPRLSVGHWGSFSFDVQRLISVFGTGVDLFFVLSGFCLYLMYIPKKTEWSWKSYGSFIKRRWLRLGPAFYVAALVSALGIWWLGRPFPWKDLLAHSVFAHTFFEHTNRLNPPFWSLATEWHFYIILPLVIWATFRWRFWPVLTLLMVSSFLFRIWMYMQPAATVWFWRWQLPPKLIEFGWGICMARLFVNGIRPPALLRGAGGFVVALCITFLGRLLATAEIVRGAGRWAPVSFIFSEPILTLGYALMLWNVISSPSLFSRLFSLPVVQTIGRWSYSLYLWHFWPAYFFAKVMTARFGPTLLAQYITFSLEMLVVLIVGKLSYNWLEEPYFNRWRKKGDV
jgi:peptidoglycan/LPS O-acetylase OafA/YrhL